jgi:hypothetical protein
MNSLSNNLQQIMQDTDSSCENIVLSHLPLLDMPQDDDYLLCQEEENKVDVDIKPEKVKSFISKMKTIYSDVEKDFKLYSSLNKSNSLKPITEKYPHLKRQRLTKRTKKIEENACIYELLEKPEYSEYFKDLDRSEKEQIYKYCIKKIRGIYKHAQALKTGYCNLQIINGFSEENSISVCITKNTLEANEQWLERLFKELDNRFPHIKLNDKIIIISSKKNDLNGNATHCKDINAAWKYLKRANSFKLIFICSNKIRISDVKEMSEDFQNLKIDLQKNLRIFHDEAHNPKEGIPAYRYLIENIIIQTNVLSYTPITASNNTLVEEGNPLWNEKNIEKFALNYTTNFDKTKSNSECFSSCNKAIRISFETLVTNPNWRNYGVAKFPIDTFTEVHNSDIMKNKISFSRFDLVKLKNILTKEIDLFKNQNIITSEIDISNIISNINVYSVNDIIDKILLINIERRRTLEFCDFMKNDKELEAVNNGLNCLNMNKLIENYYIYREFNIYIISTPNRRTLTRYLCEEAVKQDFNPIVLGIYGNEGKKYHLMYDNQEHEMSDIMNKGEFNVKLDNLFTYLKESNIDINRPFIIIGNYTPTGESLTFVNYTYGIIRGNIRLISTNVEEDYQEASRNNYMTTKFLENDPNWVMPEKYLIGPKSFIDNALSYEKANDDRIDLMILRTNDENINNSIIMPSGVSQLPPTDGIVAIPIRITLDRSDPIVKEMIEIAEKSRKTDEDKTKFLEKLKEYIESGEAEFEDKTRKFNFDTFTLTNFRTYKKKETGPEKGTWKFSSYQNHFMLKTPFINSINDIHINECEILTCMDTYILTDINGVEIEKNLKTVWWIGYKYE